MSTKARRLPFACGRRLMRRSAGLGAMEAGTMFEGASGTSGIPNVRTGLNRLPTAITTLPVSF